MLDLKKWIAKINNFVNLNRIRTATVSGRTDANGNLRTDVGEGAKVILFAWDGSNVFIPFYYSGQWYLRVQQSNASGTARINTQITCNVYYVVGGGST